MKKIEVPGRGLEPPSLSAQPPQDCAFTNFAIPAIVLYLFANSNFFSKSGIMLARLAPLGSQCERGAPTRRAFRYFLRARSRLRASKE